MDGNILNSFELPLKTLVGTSKFNVSSICVGVLLLRTFFEKSLQRPDDLAHKAK